MLSAYFLWIPGILPPKGGDKMAGKGLRARLKMWMMEYAYLATAGAIAAIVAASAMYTHRIRTEEGIQAAADAPETVAQVQDMQAEKPAVTPAGFCAVMTRRKRYTGRRLAATSRMLRWISGAMTGKMC